MQTDRVEQSDLQQLLYNDLVQLPLQSSQAVNTKGLTVYLACINIRPLIHVLLNDPAPDAEAAVPHRKRYLQSQTPSHTHKPEALPNPRRHAWLQI